MPYEGVNYGGSGISMSWREYQDYLNQKYGMNRGQSGIDPARPWTSADERNKAIFRGERAGQDAVRGILGGPVGWFEMAQGKGLLGSNDPFAGSAYSGAMTEEVFNSMDDADWARFKKMTGAEQQAFVNTRIREIDAWKNDPERLAREKAEKDLADKRAKRELAQDDLIARITQFAKEMNMPVSELMQKDEFAQALNASTYQNTMGSGLNAGAGGGGLSQLNADMATKRALLGYQSQRQQMGQQAMNSAFNMLANQNAAAEDIARYNQGLNLELQGAEAMRRQQEYMQGLGAAQGTAGMFGAIIGGAFGGPSGAAMGQSIGSGLGGMRYQGEKPYRPYRYTYPSSSRPSSMGGPRYGSGGNY